MFISTKTAGVTKARAARKPQRGGHLLPGGISGSSQAIQEFDQPAQTSGWSRAVRRGSISHLDRPRRFYNPQPNLAGDMAIPQPNTQETDLRMMVSSQSSTRSLLSFGTQTASLPPGSNRNTITYYVEQKDSQCTTIPSTSLRPVSLFWAVPFCGPATPY
ncbi:hypothetical protein LA080_016285 [Diaporthe eres]|nr:hypothetical protein LA080_016285 [Diaporthe eres]